MVKWKGCENRSRIQYWLFFIFIFLNFSLLFIYLIIFFIRDPEIPGHISQSLWADCGPDELSGHFQRVISGCSQAQPHLCRVLFLGSCHKSSSFSSLTFFPCCLCSMDERCCKGIKKTHTDRQTSLIGPSLILSFSSIHNRFPLKVKAKSLGRNMPQKSLRLQRPRSKKYSPKRDFQFGSCHVVFCGFLSIGTRTTLLPSLKTHE